MKHATLFGLFVLALGMLLVGCATRAETFNQRLLVAYNTVTEVRTQTKTLLQVKKITSTDAENIQRQADTARAGLDVARSLRSTQPLAAEDRLTATRAVLLALQTYLIAQQAKEAQ
jgi:hypothetical protein